MIRLRIAVLDQDREYLERLQAYLIQRKDIFFQILIYSDPNSYIQSKKQVDALLVTGDFWEAVVGKREGVKEILLHEGWIPKAAEGVFTIAKYQSAENLLRQVSAVFWQEKEKEGNICYAKQAKLIGVYSPMHIGSQLLVTMTMAKIIGEQEKVLYVNLMEHSGFYSLTETEPKEDIGDLLYGMLENDNDFTVGLHSIRKTYANFDYIPPITNPEHLSETPKELYEKLFRELKYKSGYDTVIIDFGRVFLGFAELVTVLEKLYCIGRNGKMDCCSMDEFEEYMSKEMHEKDKKIEKMILPEKFGYWESTYPLENSCYGEIGKYR